MNAQVFEVATIQYHGDPSKYINLVILGDGYTASEQNNFVQKANELTNYLFTQAPWSNYKNYFNVYAIKAISNESGVKHANTASDCSSAFPLVPTANPDNYFGTRFDYGGIHRLVVPTNNTRIANVLAANFANYDQVLIPSNSPYYGGSGGSVATTTANAAAYEVTAHELGHSFAFLADEYYAGDQYFFEKANMTQQSNPALIKWKNWINTDEINIGIFNYCCGGNSNLWYKPTSNHCKMEVLGSNYCAVCRETIIEKVHTLTNPIVSYAPTETAINSTNPILDFGLTELMKPIPNSLKITWQLDASVFENDSETFQIDQNTLTEGIHSLTASVTDNSDYVRVDNHPTTHIQSVTWTINRSNLGISWETKETAIGLSLFPNPTSDFVNVSLELKESASVTISIISMDGKTIQTFLPKEFSAGKNNCPISVATLSRGNYVVALKINGVNYSKLFIKK